MTIYVIKFNVFCYVHKSKWEKNCCHVCRKLEEWKKMQLGVWIGILLSAILSFFIGDYYGQPLHWYLFILMVIIGFFINTVILIIKTRDENT